MSYLIEYTYDGLPFISTPVGSYFSLAVQAEQRSAASSYTAQVRKATSRREPIPAKPRSRSILLSLEIHQGGE